PTVPKIELDPAQFVEKDAVATVVWMIELANQRLSPAYHPRLDPHLDAKFHIALRWRQTTFDRDIGAGHDRLHPWSRCRERVQHHILGVLIDLRRFANGQHIWDFATDEKLDNVASAHRLLSGVCMNAGERDRPV